MDAGQVLEVKAVALAEPEWTRVDIGNEGKREEGDAEVWGPRPRWRQCHLPRRGTQGGWAGGWGQEFCSGHVKCETPVRPPRRAWRGH